MERKKDKQTNNKNKLETKEWVSDWHWVLDQTLWAQPGQSLLAPSRFSAHAGCLVSFTVNDCIKSANKYTMMVKDTCRQCYRKSELDGPQLQCNQESEIPEQVEGEQPPIERSGHLSIWHIIPQDKLHRTWGLFYLLMKVFVASKILCGILGSSY